MKLKASIFIVIATVIFQLNTWAEESIIYLTRHGKSHWNVEDKWQGTTDTFLNLEGITQAGEKAAFFQNMPLDAIYCSPLQRAYLTAEIIAAVHEKKPIISFAFMEPWFAQLEGMYRKDVHHLIFPRLLSMSQEERRNNGFLEGLLSLSRVAERAETEIKKLGEQHLGKTIVNVSHSNIIECIVAMHTDAIPETIKMSNMAYLKYAYDGEKLTLLEISPDITYKNYEKQT